MTPQLQSGDVVYSEHACPNGSWWLVFGTPGDGQNSVFLHGQLPRGWTEEFPADRRTHWSDSVMRDQGAEVVPPERWPTEVCAALARYALTGKVPA